MVDAGGNEDGVALLQLQVLSLDIQQAAPFEDDVELVGVVRALVIGLRCDERIDPDLEKRRLVDDLETS